MPLTRAIGVVLATAACARPDAAGPGDYGIRLLPDTIEFGDVAWTDTASSPLTLKNYTGAVASVSLVPSSEAFVIENPGPFLLDPQASVAVAVDWDAGSFEELNASIDVRVDGVARYVVPVHGVSSFPHVALSSDQYDVGDVVVGCSVSIVGVLINEGADPLVVSSVALVDEGEFVLEFEDEALVAPFSIPAHRSMLFHVAYAPTEPHESSTAIRILSNDPITPSVEIAIFGRGVPVDAANAISLSWTVPPPPIAITALVEINAEVARVYEDALTTSLAVFVDTLHETGIPFRLGITSTMTESGDDLSLAYVDSTMSAYTAMTAVRGLLADVDGDADNSLQRLNTAILENRGWVADDDPLWQDSSLSLVVINYDAEQSPEPASVYVERYQTYRDDPSAVFVDAIAGPVPQGCHAGTGVTSAAASENLFDAVELTNGRFLSICEDWTSNFEQLALTLQGLPSIALTDEPRVESIEVAVDGSVWSSGWSYLASTNEIYFDEGSSPAVGSMVDVRYTTADACD